jgi:hypothetical protein
MAHDTSDKSEKEADLGVLFVHGIGQQGRGDTLLAAGEALHEWLARWFTAGQVARGTTRGALTPLTSDLAAPAHVFVEMTRDEEASVWLLAESWWAESFPAPGFKDLAIWAFQVMPWTLTSHFAVRAKRARLRIGWVTGVRRLWSILRFSVDVVLFLLSFLVLVPLVLLFGLLAVVGAIPIRAVRGLVGRVQRVLSSSLGDSYVLLTSAIKEAAIEDTVRRDLEWLAAKCAKVAIVAHSQGAAISHAVLKTDIPDNVRLFVSVGSGLNKLAELRRAKEDVQPRQVTPLQGPTVPYAGSVGFALIAYAVYGFMAGQESFLPIISVVAGLMSLTLALLRVWWGYPPRNVDDLMLPTAIRWVDLYASADPVPNGPLFDPTEPPRIAGPTLGRDRGLGLDAPPPAGDAADSDTNTDGERGEPQGTLPASAMVHNRGSLLKDHNDYWRNRDAFMGVVAQELSALGALGDLAGLERDDLVRLEVAPRRRRWRVGWLSAARTIVILAAVSVPLILWATDGLDEVGLPVTTAIEWVLDVLPLSSSTDLGAGTTDLAAVLSILAAAYLAFLTMQWLWRWWGYVETHRLYRRRSYEGLPKQALLMGAAAAMVVEVAVLTASGRSSNLASAYQSTAVIALSVLIVAVMFWAVFVNRFLELLWRGLPGGWSLIGPPAEVSAVPFIVITSATALAVFPAYGAFGRTDGDPQAVLWSLLASVVLLLVLALVWNTRPLYDARRRLARWSYAGNIHLAQLRHADSDDDRRTLLQAAASRLTDETAAASAAVDEEEKLAPSQDLGDATRWRRASAVAQHAARDTVDVAAGLVAMGDTSRAEALLAVAALHGAPAAVALIGLRGDDAETARALLEPLTRTGPRRDRRIARRALARR